MIINRYIFKRIIWNIISIILFQSIKIRFIIFTKNKNNLKREYLNKDRNNNKLFIINIDIITIKKEAIL